MSNNNFNPVTVTVTASPQRVATQGASEPEQMGAPTADSDAEMRAMFAAMQQQMLQMQQQMALMSRGNSRRSISEALHTAQGERAGEYSGVRGYVLWCKSGCSHGPRQRSKSRESRRAQAVVQT